MATTARAARRPVPVAATEAPAPAPVAPEDRPEPTTAEADSTESAESQAASALERSQQGSRTLSIPGIRATFTDRSLILPEKVSIKEWVRVVDAIDGVREGARWWLGDAIRAGESRWSETYAQALDSTKYNEASLRNIVMVAKRYPPERRIYNLSWSHYHSVIGVPLDVACEILAVAEANDWPVAAVREHVKEIKAGNQTATPPTGNGIVPGMTEMVAAEDLPGVKPLTDDEIKAATAAGQTVYECEGCQHVFGVQVWHCLGCNGHWPLSADDCQNPHCGEEVVPSSAATTTVLPPTQPTPSAAPRVVTGTVVVPDDTGVDQALSVLMSFPFADLDPSDIASSLLTRDDLNDPVASLLSLQHWLGQVIESMASDDDDAEGDAQEAPEGDDLGDLDFGDAEAESDENGPESDETDEGAPEAVTATTEAPAATTTPSGGRPLSPAPKPGTGKPVRRRAAKAS